MILKFGFDSARLKFLFLSLEAPLFTFELIKNR